jgi:GT2 family glycosyltransferase
MSPETVSLSAVVIVWDGRRFLPDCLSTLAADLAEIAHEIIVVDNGSSDGSAAWVRANFPKVRVIANESNLGFTRAVNIGIRAACGNVIYLLNQDLRFRPGGTRLLLERVKTDPSIGLIGPAFYGFDGELQQSARAFPRYRHVVFEALGLSRLLKRHRVFSDWRMGWFDHRNERDVDQPMGAAMMIPRRVIERLGRFDESFPIYFSDVDFCKRLAEAGLRRVYCPGAEVEHFVGGSTSQTPVRSRMRAHLYLYRYLRKYSRWYSRLGLWGCGLLLLMGLIPALFEAGSRRRTGI